MKIKLRAKVGAISASNLNAIRKRNIDYRSTTYKFLVK